MASEGAPSDIAVTMEGHASEGASTIATTTPPPSSALVSIPHTTSTPHEGDVVAAKDQASLRESAAVSKDALAVEKAGKEKVCFAKQHYYQLESIMHDALRRLKAIKEWI
jgi:hypothetical protein